MEIIDRGFSGTRSGTAFFEKTFWCNISKEQRKRILGVLANTGQQDVRVKGRSLLYQLAEDPEGVRVEDRCIRSLRFKGIAPHLNLKGRVLEHRGNGFVGRPIAFDENGVAGSVVTDKGQPAGSMIESYGRDEYDVAKDCGPEICDLPVGFGHYNDYRYEYEGQEQRLGFVIFGHETNYDRRIDDHFNVDRIVPERARGSCGLNVMYGAVLKAFHDKGYVHQYPVENNMGIELNDAGIPSRVIIRDLETALPLRELTVKQAYGYLFGDIAKVLMGFNRGLGTPYTRKAVEYKEFSDGYFNGCHPFSIDDFYFNERIQAEFGRIFDRIEAQEKVDIAKELENNPTKFMRFLHEFISAKFL